MKDIKNSPFTTTPQVSVIIPCYNTEEYLREAVISVLSQQGMIPSFEVIIVDDYSTNHKTQLLIEELKSFDSRLIVVTNKKHKGVSGARNTGISMARGEWVAFLDSDDFWPTSSLSTRWSFHLNHPEIDLVCTDYQHWYGGHTRDEPWGKRWLSELSEFDNAYQNDEPVLLNHPVKLMKHGVICLGTVLVRKSIVASLGGFDEALKIAEDYQLWIKISSVGSVGYIPSVCLHYRRHGKSLTHKGFSASCWKIPAIKKLVPLGYMEEYREFLMEELEYHENSECFFYRRKNEYLNAVLACLNLLRDFPYKVASWRQFLASIIGR